MDKLGPRQVIRIVVVSMLIFSSALVSINSDLVDDKIASTIADDQDQQEYDLVGLSSEEKWPVIRISFPGKDFPNSLLGDIFDGDLSAQGYISEMSGNKSQLIPTIIDEVWESPYDDSHWGADSDFERDTGSGSGGARELATQAIVSLFRGRDMSPWDLNGDYVIDRLLILHSGQPQEEGGPSSTIWSHFSGFHEPVIVGDYRFEHYTMASVHGGLGVTVHEMLHQMGAVDLYDVHSESPTKSWHGLGDWDIMASGNWLGDGGKPSLPSSSTLELIGATNPIMPDNQLDANFSLQPISIGGKPLKIEIAPEEYIWITLRSDIGFDSGLPGHGILVEQQDLTFGDIASNLVNTDPTKPWVKIVEADGNDALLRGRDYGSQGDTFSVGDRFGHTGMQIWNNRGMLVPWTITVTSLTDDSSIIEFDYVGNPNLTLSLPRNPIVLLPNESALVEINADPGCSLSSELSSSSQVQSTGDGKYIVQILTPSQESSVEGEITGTIGCLNSPMTHVSIDWYVVNHRFSTDTLEVTIPWDEASTVELFPDAFGDGPRSYSIAIDGPASRISDPITSGTYYPGDPIVISIDPAGLLEPRMIARGELVFIDSYNIEQRIPIILNSQGELPFGPLNWLAVPSNAISTILLLLAVSTATSARRTNVDN